MQIFTTTLTTGTLEIERADGAMFLSVQTSADASCNIIGNIAFKGVQPNSVLMNGGQIVNYTASSPQSPLDGIVITHIFGNIDIIIGF